jgi:hypothetical protein
MLYYTIHAITWYATVCILDIIIIFLFLWESIVSSFGMNHSISSKPGQQTDRPRTTTSKLVSIEKHGHGQVSASTGLLVLKTAATAACIGVALPFPAARMGERVLATQPQREA